MDKGVDLNLRFYSASISDGNYLGLYISKISRSY